MRDIHVWEAGKSEVIVSNGKVISVTNPSIKFCPIHYAIWKNKMGKESIRKSMEFRIKTFGLCTPERIIESDVFALGLGASESLATALNREMIDCCVVVCDGAGTVITDKSEVVQGIGMVMSALLKTSSISEIIEKLEEKGAVLLTKDAKINQVEGTKKAFEMGYKKVGVTIAGEYSRSIVDIEELERRYAKKALKLVVHTTGVREELLPFIKKADIVTSCASKVVRECIGDKARAYGRTIPVYALTKFGEEVMDAQREVMSRRGRILEVPHASPYPLL
jgi:putative methanogenesis marker protein 8